MKPVPRLSRALRAFTNLGLPSSGKLNDLSHNLAELRSRQKNDNKY